MLHFVNALNLMSHIQLINLILIKKGKTNDSKNYTLQ
jgi:hypothetical protein